MKNKSLLKWIWEEMGRSDKTRRRNALILIVLTAIVIICGFFSGAISISIQRMMQ